MSTNYMSTGRILLKDDKLVSNNGEFTAIFQGDGNFVVYDKCGPIWASHSNHAKAQELILQEDGNLVLYTSQGTAIWSSKTNCCNNSVASHLTLTDQGALILYRNRKVVWSSK